MIYLFLFFKKNHFYISHNLYPHQEGKKYFSRKDLQEAERKDYEKRHGLVREDQSKPKLSADEKAAKYMEEMRPESSGNKLPMNLSRQEVCFDRICFLAKRN